MSLLDRILSARSNGQATVLALADMLGEGEAALAVICAQAEREGKLVNKLLMDGRVDCWRISFMESK